TNSTERKERRSSFLKRLQNSTKTLRVRLPDWRELKIGFITTLIQLLRARKKRAPRQRQRFDCSRICPKRISRSDFITTTVSAIIRQRSTNSPLRGRVCQTPRKFTWPLARSSAARVN